MLKTALRGLAIRHTVTAAEGTLGSATVPTSINGKSSLLTVSVNNKSNDGWAETQIQAPGSSLWLNLSKLAFLQKNIGHVFQVKVPTVGLPAKVRANYRGVTAADDLATNFLFIDKEGKS